jgi:choline-sulfatase
MKRKNILFIMADQMAAPLLPIYGPSPIKMPNLAASPHRPWCSTCLLQQPAVRAVALHPGQRPVAEQDRRLRQRRRFPADVPTYAHYLRRLGYRTALSGKMHFCGPDQLHGYEERLTSDIYPADYGWAVNWDEPDVRPSWYHNMSSVLQAGRACAPTSWISTKRWCSRPSSTCSTTSARTATSRSA